ncbi:MAG TPA: MarR family transcriptional regulator [Saprospiraceae bacterium]|nr:MarR family transcriptional regulator [Saprospiraceae bacterium]HRF39046.1 MarR family transcriptional regulator [Saprospiraceae bacterium]HRJ17322.1 MarR family transcriptional regulator [Saprospiraceae bacterium]
MSQLLIAMTNHTAEIDWKADTSGFVLERTARRMKQFVQEHLTQAGAGITVDQWLILQELDRQDGQSQLDIAKATYKDPPTMTRILDILVEKGLVHRAHDPADRRRFNILLTPAGRSKIEEVLPLVRAARREAWGGLSEPEMAELTRMLDAVFQHLQGQ